jgi:di/tricarboxylate transporter
MHSQEASCAYALGIMATYWVTEALPLAVTALLPFVLFPLLGLLGGKQIAATYISVSYCQVNGLTVNYIDVAHYRTYGKYYEVHKGLLCN